MANRYDERGGDEYRAKPQRDFVRFFAFWGLIIAGALFLLSGVFGYIQSAFEWDLTWLDITLSILWLVADVALLIAVAVPAYRYVKARKTAWKVVYIVFLVLYIVGIVFQMATYL